MSLEIKRPFWIRGADDQDGIKEAEAAEELYLSLTGITNEVWGVLLPFDECLKIVWTEQLASSKPAVPPAFTTPPPASSQLR